MYMKCTKALAIKACYEALRIILITVLYQPALLVAAEENVEGSLVYCWPSQKAGDRYYVVDLQFASQATKTP